MKTLKYIHLQLINIITNYNNTNYITTSNYSLFTFLIPPSDSISLTLLLASQLFCGLDYEIHYVISNVVAIVAKHFSRMVQHSLSYHKIQHILYFQSTWNRNTKRKVSDI